MNIPLITEPVAVIECDELLTSEQRDRFRLDLSYAIDNGKTLVLPRGMRYVAVKRDGDQLNRIEQMLITLVAALAADEEPEIPETDLDGNVVGSDRDANEPL